MRHSFLRSAQAGAVALATLALAVPSALPATAQNLAAPHHGHTRVAIAPPLAKLLRGAGIQVAPRGAATAATFRNTVAAKFPITSIRKHQLVFTHKGGLRFSAGKVSISTGRFRVSLIKNRVSGRVTGSKVGDAGRVVLFTWHKTNRPKLGDVRLELTKGAAGAFDATLDVTAFSKGDTFGYASVNPC